MDAVRVMTIHGSKGLEFRAVHLPALATGYMPASWRGVRIEPPTPFQHLADAARWARGGRGVPFLRSAIAGERFSFAQPRREVHNAKVVGFKVSERLDRHIGASAIPRVWNILRRRLGAVAARYARPVSGEGAGRL